MNDLVSIIKQKQAAIAKLQAELDEARAALTDDRSPMATAQLAAHSPRAGSRKGYQGKSRGRSRSGRQVGVPGIVPTSSVGMTVEVLRRAGKPLHVNEIVKAIEERGKKISKGTLTGNLWRYVKDKRVFYRAGRNIFGLLELREGA